MMDPFTVRNAWGATIRREIVRNSHPREHGNSEGKSWAIIILSAMAIFACGLIIGLGVHR